MQKIKSSKKQTCKIYDTLFIGDQIGEPITWLLEVDLKLSTSRKVAINTDVK